MKKEILAGLIIIASSVIVISFFLPWAKIDTSASEVSRGITGVAREGLGGESTVGKLIGKFEKEVDKVSAVADIRVKAAVSGYDIPVMVNNKTSKIAIAAAQIIFKSAKNLDMKSYLVYLLPLFGIFCGAAAILGLKNKLSIIVALIVSGIVSITGLYNLYTTDLSSLILNISIEKGLWCTMYAFLFIFFAGIAWLVSNKYGK